MRARLARADVDGWIVQDGDDPVGYLQSWWEDGEPRRGGLDGFLVPEARGRGVMPAAARSLARRLLATGWADVTVDPYGGTTPPFEPGAGRVSSKSRGTRPTTATPPSGCSCASCREVGAGHRGARHPALLPSSIQQCGPTNLARPCTWSCPTTPSSSFPDGATGVDAARAIGPKLAEQAVLVRADGSVRDLRAPLSDGERIQILTTSDATDPDALAVLRHSSAHLLAEAVRRLYPGVKIAIGPPIENGFYYDFEFPDPIGEADLPRIEEEIAREIAEGREWSREAITRDEAHARFQAEGEPYKVELVDTAEGEHLAVHAGRLHRPLPRPAPAERKPDQGDQAHRPRRRVLARRRAQHPARLGSTAPRSTRRPTSTPTSSGSRKLAAAITVASGRSSTCSISPSTRRARPSGTRRGW